MHIIRKNSRKILIIFSILLILQIVIPIFYTRSQSIQSSGETFRLLTYNVQESNYSDLLTELRLYTADVIALQEVDTNSDLDIINELQIIADELGLYLVNFTDYVIYNYGLVLMSRFPILTSEFIDYTYIEYARSRGVQQALLSTPQGELQVFNTHLNTPNFYTTRFKQVSTILDSFDTSENSILMGDFNTPSSIFDYTYNKLSTEFEDAWVVAGNFHGFGKTYHSKASFMRIDYIFVSSDVGVVKESAKLIENVNLSDHKGVLVDIALEY